MRRLLNYFLRGLVLVAPIFVTVYVCWTIFVTIDGLLGLPVPGAGFAVTIVLIVAVGFLASSYLSRHAVALVDRVMARLPFVRLLYSSTKDLLNAFVGERRRFETPVLVALAPGSTVRLLGFVTQDSLAHLGLAGQVAVYLPHSYTFAGNLVVVPATQVERVTADSADVMAFIVSGGVAGIPSTGTSARTGRPGAPAADILPASDLH